MTISNLPFEVAVRLERKDGAQWRQDRAWLIRNCKGGWHRMIEGRFDGQPDPGQQLYKEAQNGIIKALMILYKLPPSTERDIALAQLDQESGENCHRVSSHDLIEFEDKRDAMMFKLARC